MSLPVGVSNQHSMAAPRPALLGGFVRIALRVVWLVMPLIIHSAAQAPGVNWMYQGSNMRIEIGEKRGEIRRLQAERARLLNPSRLRVEAVRLGLVPTPPDAPRALDAVLNGAAAAHPAPWEQR